VVLLLVITGRWAYTRQIMKLSREWSGLHEHIHEADGVFDALGFSGEGGEYDDVGALIAIRNFLQQPTDETDETQQDVESWLVTMHHIVKSHSDTSEGEAASRILGYAVGRKVISSTTTYSDAQNRELIDRAFQGVYLTWVAHGRGDIDTFYGAFLDIACSYSEQADAATLHRIRSMARHAASHKLQVNRLDKRQARSEKQFPKLWPHVIQGLASIAMIPHYRIVPPPEQTDENGTWDPGHDKFGGDGEESDE
jgi:hypothetical protein